VAIKENGPTWAAGPFGNFKAICLQKRIFLKGKLITEIFEMK
jgi:hypothetical protein